MSFSMWQLFKGIFPSGYFPTLQFPKRQLPKSILTVTLGPHCSLRSLRGPEITLGKLPMHIWEVPTWEVALGKMSLGKYLTPIITLLF